MAERVGADPDDGAGAAARVVSDPADPAGASGSEPPAPRAGAVPVGASTPGAADEAASVSSVRLPQPATTSAIAQATADKRLNGREDRKKRVHMRTPKNQSPASVRRA